MRFHIDLLWSFVHKYSDDEEKAYLVIIDYLLISFHGNFVELEDIRWKRDTIGKPQMASLTPQKLSKIQLSTYYMYWSGLFF